MTKMSFLDKIGVLVDVSKSSSLFIVAIFILGIVGYLLYSTNKKNEKITKKIYLGIVLGILAIVLIIFHKSLGDMFDYMMNNLFIAVYFPNVAIYLAALIIMNVILYISIFNYKISKLIKNINVIVYCILNYILILILNIIMTKKLDVFTQASIYQNKQAQALIELSSVIFVLWIIFLIVYRIIMIYLKKEYKVPVKVKKVYVKEKVSMLPENISKIEAPSFAKAVPEKPLIEVKEVEEDTLTKKIEDNLTLEDYKVLLKMLKEQKRKERLARMKKQQEHDEQAKFRELQELYRSVK